MKAIALKAFRDKETQVTHKEGDEVEVTPRRFAEINEHHRGPFLTAKKTKAEPPAGPTKGAEPPVEPPAGC